MKQTFIFFAAILLACQSLSAQAGFSVSPQLCSNAITVLTASTGAMSNCTYSWSGSPAGINFSAVNASVTNVSFSSAGNYSILLTIASGTLVSTLQAGVGVFAPPVIVATASSYTTCVTNNYPLTTKVVTLTANGGTSYTWTPPPNQLQAPLNAAATSITLTGSSCFSVIGQNSVGCAATAVACVSVAPQFTIAVTPASTLICQGLANNANKYVDLTILHSAPPFGQQYTYLWTGFGLVTSNASYMVKAAPMSTSSFTAEAYDSQGCVSVPAVATVSVVVCTDLPVLSNKDSFSFYPNPVDDKLFISGAGDTSEGGIKLYNSLGQLVKSVTPSESFIDLSDLPKGVYILQTETHNSSRTNKIIKR